MQLSKMHGALRVNNIHGYLAKFNDTRAKFDMNIKTPQIKSNTQLCDLIRDKALTSSLLIFL